MGMEYKHDDDDNLHIFNDRLGEDMKLVFDMENDESSVFTTKDRKIYVKKDGSGDYTTIGDAFEYAQRLGADEPVTIIVGRGRYFEKLRLKKSNVTIIGEGADCTVVENNCGAKDFELSNNPLATYETATMRIDEGSDNFRCEGITVVNSAGLGKEVGQAIAMYIDCDKSVVRNCAFKANQDTLLITPNHVDYDKNRDRLNRAYFENCYIEGNIDFIFGGGTAVFDNCEIFCKKREKGAKSYITACCTPKSSAFGFVFRDCRITGDAEVGSVYLGRPWREYAKCSFIRCDFSAVVSKNGFIAWNKTANHSTSCYEVCACAGIDTDAFVDWCYILDDSEKDEYTCEQIFKDWKPF